MTIRVGAPGTEHEHDAGDCYNRPGPWHPSHNRSIWPCGDTRCRDRNALHRRMLARDEQDERDRAAKDWS